MSDRSPESKRSPVSEHKTPFQAVSREPPRLDWRTRLNSLLGATATALVVGAVVILVWNLWVAHLRSQIDPVQVWYEPWDGLEDDPESQLPTP